MSYDPTSHRRNDSHASGSHAAVRPGGRSGAFDPITLARKYPSLQPTGAHAGFPPIPLHRAITLIGSRKSARIHLNSTAVSRAHVLIVVTPYRVHACDLLSREGTFVKGQRISEIELRNGDELRVGNFAFTFHDPRPRVPFEAPAIEPLALQVDLPAGPQKLRLDKRVTLLGRRGGSDLQLPFSNVSTANTAIVRLEGFVGESDSMAFVGYAVFDLGGKGTMLNRRPVHKQRIRAGDELRIGPAKLQVLALPQEQALKAGDSQMAPAATASGVAMPVPAADEAPALAGDFDDILLDEDMTPAGLEEDLLGGSHVMSAITEPQAKSPAPESDDEAAPGAVAWPEAEEEPAPEQAIEPGEPQIAGGQQADAAVEAGLEEDAWEEPVASEQAAETAEGDGWNAPATAGHEDEWGEANEPFPLEEAVIDTPEAAGEPEEAAEPWQTRRAEERAEAEWSPALADEAETAEAPEAREEETGADELAGWPLAEKAAEEETGAGWPAEEEAPGRSWSGEAAIPDDAFALDAPEADEPEADEPSLAHEPVAFGSRPEALEEPAGEMPGAEPIAEEGGEEAEAVAKAAEPEDEWSVDDAAEVSKPPVAEAPGGADDWQREEELAEAPAAEAWQQDEPATEITAEAPAVADLAEEPEPEPEPDFVDEAPQEPVAAFAEPEEREPEEIDLSRLDFASAAPAAPEDAAEASTTDAVADDEPTDAPIREPMIPSPPPATPPVERPADRPRRRKGTGRRKPVRGAAGAAAMFEADAFAAEPESAEPEAAAQPFESSEAEAQPEPQYFEPAATAGEVETPVSPVPAEPATAEPASLGDADEEIDLQTAIDLEGVAESAAEERREPSSELTGAADESGAVAGAPAGGSVSDTTEPVPESALNLRELEGYEKAAARPRRDAPTALSSSLSDSAFALELEALSDSRGGDLVDAPPPQKSAAPVFKATPQPAAAPATAEPARQEPKAPQKPAGGTGQSPARSWRDEWAREASAFLGNLTPLDPTPSLPVSTPRAIPPVQQPAARKPEAPEPREQAPEGLGEDYTPRQPDRAPSGQRPLRGPQPHQHQAAAPARPAPQVPAKPVTPQAEPVGAGAGGLSPGAPRNQSQAPRPKTVGFAGAVVEVDDAVAHAARNPFSSAPIASGGDPASMLDASSAIPQTSGLVGFTEVSLPPASEREPVMPEASAWAPPAQETRQQQPAQSGQGQRLIPDSDSGDMDDDLTDDQARVDEFLRTVRGGVSRAHAPSENGQNGHARNGYPGGDDGLLRGGQTAIGRVKHEMAVEAEAAGPRRRRSAWLVPVLIGLMVAAMIGAVAGIYYGMQPTVPVTLKQRYEIPPTLSESDRASYLEAQLRALADPSMQPAALEALRREYPNVKPSYLGDATQYNKFVVNGAVRSAEEPDVLLLRREVVEGERDAEMARLKAVGFALYDRAGTDRAMRDRLAGEVRQLEDELEKLLRDAESVGNEIEETVAGLPRDPGSDPADRRQQEQELAQRSAQLEDQWNDADRRARQLKSQVQAMESASPLVGDEQLAEMKRRLTDIEAQLASGGAPAAQERAEPAGSAVTGAAADDEPGLVMPEEELPANPERLRSLVEERMRSVTAAADAAGRGEAGEAVVDDVVELNRLTAELLDEVIPRHVLKAGEVEMLHQALLRTRRQRMVERLEADEAIQTLRGEVALKERELGAALSDGLTDRAAGLRMALRMSRDRLTLRTNQIEAALEQDEQVMSATQSYERVRAGALEALAEERTAFEAAASARQRAVLAAADEQRAPALRRALGALESAVRALIRVKTQDLAVTRQVWTQEKRSAPAEDDADAAPAGAEDPELSQSREMPQMVSYQQDDPPASQPVSLEEQANALRQQIEEREEELREAHATKLAELRQEMAAAEAAAAKAQNEAQQARAQLNNLQAGAQAQERTRQRLADMRLEKHDLETQVAEKHDLLKQTRAAASVLATPLPPTDAAIQAPLQGKDDRPLMMVAALLGILAIFLVPLYFTMRSDSRR